MRWNRGRIRLRAGCRVGGVNSPQRRRGRRDKRREERERERERKSKAKRERGVSGVRAGFGERHFGLERGVVQRTLRRPGLSGYRRAYPAASDLVGIYEDVGAVLMPWAHRASPRWNSQPLYPMGRRSALSEHHRQLSARTEDLPAGLLHVGEPPRSFLGLTGSQHHRTCNASWPG